MIVGGITNGAVQRTTQVINVANTNITNSFGNIPNQRLGLEGGLLGSSPIICGGSLTSLSNDSCLTFQQSQWTQTHTLTIPRMGSASVQVNSTTLWLIGGYDYIGDGDTTEFIGIDSSVGIPGPKLPIPLIRTCAVKFAEDQIFVIGGIGHCKSSEFCWNRVFIFNPLNGFTHIKGRSLKNGRWSHSCGLMSNGQDTKIVVAGGFVPDPPYAPKLSDVEIFDPYIKDWITGNKCLVSKIYG